MISFSTVKRNSTLDNIKEKFAIADSSDICSFENKSKLEEDKSIIIDFTNLPAKSFSKTINSDIDSSVDIVFDEVAISKMSNVNNKLHIGIDALDIVKTDKANKLPGLIEGSNHVIMIVH